NSEVCDVIDCDVRPLIDLMSNEFKSEEYEKLKTHIRNNSSRLPDLQILNEYL
ncbi:unnamed protein product, partial [Ceratitis capitata]